MIYRDQSGAEGVTGALQQQGFAGPFRLDDINLIDRLNSFIEDHREPGILSWILSKLEVSQDQRLQQRYGHLVFRPLFDVALDKAVMAHVMQDLGPNVLLWKARILLRPANSPGQGWHVDIENKMLNGIHASFALSPMKLDNGALQVIPGTHRYREVSLQASARSGKCDLHETSSLVALADRTHPEAAPHSATTMEMDVGEYFLMKSGLWHSVLPNRTARVRTGALARYMRPEMASRIWDHDDERIVARRNRSLPCILIAGEDKYHRNRLHPAPKAITSKEAPHSSPVQPTEDQSLNSSRHSFANSQFSYPGMSGEPSVK